MVERNSRTKFPQRNSLKMLVDMLMSWDVFFSRFMSPPKGVTQSAALCRHDDAERCAVWLEAHSGHHGCLYRIIMEYTHDDYCDMLLIFGVCNSRAGNDARKFALSVWRQLYAKCFDEHHATCEWNSLSHCTGTSQWKCHNCNCG